MESSDIRKLTGDEACLSIDPKSFGFATTAELEPLEEIVGQPRALRALDLGAGMRHPHYHIFVAGLIGTGRARLIERALRQRMSDGEVPPDWVYVNNFDEPDCPLAIALPPGQGVQLRRDADNLIEDLRQSLPKAFKEDEFGKEKDRLRAVYRKKGQEIFDKLEKLAAQYGMTVQQLPDGQILFIPLKEGRPMTPEEIQKLSPEQIQELQSHQDELLTMAHRVIQEQQEMQRQLSTDVRDVARRFARHVIEPLVAELKRKYNHPKVSQWLDGLTEHVVEHLHYFREGAEAPPHPAALLMGRAEDPEQRFLDYRVNVVVDNSRLDKPPIIVEDAPNYRNVFGTIERIVDRAGRVTSNFTRIKAGSLLKANGGYLVIDIMDALLEPFVWKELKRTLKSGFLEIQVHDPFALFTITALKPEPIPLDVRLVALGEPLIYYLLYLHDEDFREIFRVKADFDSEIDRNAETGQVYGRFVRQLSDREGIQAFDASAVAELVRTGSRLVGDRKKVTSVFSHVADVAREADFWARKDNAEIVTAEHVRRAVRERVFRSDLIAEKIRQTIADGTLLISVTGVRVGQVNGLAVANLGDYAFGWPARLTASVGVGTAGLVNIERESRMSGKTFDKGMLILEGLLRNRYATDQPLALSASIAMEQSYGGVDGDSASVAELLCLLSVLADVPMRQDIAVTGSINQWGDVQAIGGVNEKVEGFFDVCRLLGFTGTQGVCIPEANVQNLVLRPDVVDALRQGQFHIWAVSHVDQAITLLSGMPAGDTKDLNTFHGRVHQRLAEISDTLRREKTTDVGRLLWTPGTPGQLPPDPRPPLPGHGG